MTDRLFITFFVGLLVWFAAAQLFYRLLRSKPQPLHALYAALASLGIALFSLLLWTSFARKSIFITWAPIATSALLLASSVLFIWKASWRGLLVWLVLSSQILIATWFHPFPKHYQQSYPLLILMLTTAVVTPIIWLTAPKQFSQLAGPQAVLARTTQTILIATALVPFFIVSLYLFGVNTFNQFVDKYNTDVALDTVVYEAVQAARHLPGPHGADQAYLPARLYLAEDAQYFPAETSPSQERQQQGLQTNNIKTVIITNANDVLSHPGPGWREVEDTVSEGDDERLFKSWVYIKE